MHEAAFDAAGIVAAYEAHDVSPSMLDAHVACLRYGYAGFNVTVPFKEAVRSNLDWVAPEAAGIGAVNTVIVRHGSLHGFNTDASGFLAALDAAGVDVAGARSLVLGAGGSARAVVHALVAKGGDITIAARSVDRAQSLAGRFGSGTRALALDAPELCGCVERADLIVNTTPLGMAHLADGSPLPPDCPLNPDTTVFDLVYGRATPLLIRARAAGCRALDGLPMLVEQGAAAFRLWTRVDPDREAMRRACVRELEARSCSVS
jgi:shikimate dehydrogenase